MGNNSGFKINYSLLFVAALLLLFGLVILSSVSSTVSQEKFGKPTYFLFHQIIYAILPGVILGYIAFRLPLGFFKKSALILILINLVLMALVFVPKLGLFFGGASRWLNLGFFSFQPSEFLKLSFILYLSVLLSKRGEGKLLKKRNENPTLIPFIFVLAVVILLLALQSDIGTLGVILFSAVAIYFSAGTPLWHSLLVVTGVLAAVGILIKFAAYRIQRISTFLNPELDPMGIGYQIKQALIAIGSGGIFGLGLGGSFQEFWFLPQSISDSIFAVFAKEAGCVGAMSLILLFLVFFWLGLKIARNSKDSFPQLFAIGFISWICLQAFINIGAMIAILPLTGIPLPFISYGGSHIVAELIGMGILLNVSKRH